jgi:hypothetical protein
LGIIKDGRFVYKRGYGMANLEHDIPISPKSVFRIASTSKQFTAMSVALLAERGTISLDDDIRGYLPEIPAYERSITIRHLIHHTSGLRDYLELMSLAGMRDEDYYTDEQVLELLARQKELNFTPGDKYLYSNTGYFLLGVIVKRASGLSLREFAEENIFKPLGMVNTHYHDDHTEIVKRRAAGYSPRETGNGGYRIDMTALDIVGDGGVFTTVEDLFLWDQNFYRNQLGEGNDDLMRQLLNPGIINDGNILDYAFGLYVEDYRGLRMISHGGSYAGFRAEVIHFPEQALSVICLANLSTIRPHSLARQVADIVLADQFPAIPTQVDYIELSERELEDKAGVYQSLTSRLISEISVQEGKLMIEAQDLTFQFAPITATTFRALDAPLNIEVKFDRSDQDTPWLVHYSEDDKEPDTWQAIQVAAPSVNELMEYVGEYHSEELDVIHKLVLENDRLCVKFRGAPQNPLRSGPRDLFWVGTTVLVFARDDWSRVSGFRVNTGRVRNVRFVKKRQASRESPC